MTEETITDGVIYVARVGVNTAAFTTPSRAKQWVQKIVQKYLSDISEKLKSEKLAFFSTFPGGVEQLVEQSATYEGAVLAYERVAKHMDVVGTMLASVTVVELNSEE